MDGSTAADPSAAMVLEPSSSSSVMSPLAASTATPWSPLLCFNNENTSNHNNKEPPRTVARKGPRRILEGSGRPPTTPHRRRLDEDNHGDSMDGGATNDNDHDDEGGGTISGHHHHHLMMDEDGNNINNNSITATVKRKKLSIGTAATVATHNTSCCFLMDQSTSSASSSESPFRFSAFPASLPRIHHHGGGGASRVSEEPPLPYPSSSSSSQQLQQQQQQYHLYRTGSGDPTEYEQNNNNDHHDDEAPEQGTPVARTRLNFTSVLSPPHSVSSSTATAASLSSPRPHYRRQAHQPHHHHHQNRWSEYRTPSSEDSSDAAWKPTPSNSSNARTSNNSGTPLGWPLPPRGRSNHYHQQHQNAQQHSQQPHHHQQQLTEVPLFPTHSTPCSPIRGDADEPSSNSNNDVNLSRETDETSSSSSSRRRRLRPLPDMAAFDAKQDSGNNNNSNATADPQPLPKLMCPPTPVRTPAWCAHHVYTMPADHYHYDDDGNNPSANHHHHAPNTNDAASEASVAGADHLSATSSSAASQSPRHSLSSTKVLATCPAQVLEGRASLESSLLEDGDEEDDTVGAPFGANILVPTLTTTTTNSNNKSEHDNNTKYTNDGDDDTAQSSSSASPRRRLLQQQHKQQQEIPAVVSLTESFDVLGLLGSGTFANVYHVRHKGSGRQFAVKKSRRQFRGQRDLRRSLLEVQYLQKLQSPLSDAGDDPAASTETSYSIYVLFFYQAWQEDGHFFCLTELCCRATVGDLISAARNGTQNQWPESNALRLIHDASAALSHVHRHGLVHGDVKPGNIFLSRRRRRMCWAKIGDFGLAGPVDTPADEEGDPAYMAPEVLKSNATRHPSADVFSLGLVLVELLWWNQIQQQPAELPAQGPQWHALRAGAPRLTELLARQPERSSQTASRSTPSAFAHDLVCRMLHPTPSERPTAMEILQAVSTQEMSDAAVVDFLQQQEEEEQNAMMTMHPDGGIPAAEDQTPRISSRTLRLCPHTGPPPPVL